MLPFFSTAIRSLRYPCASRYAPTVMGAAGTNAFPLMGILRRLLSGFQAKKKLTKAYTRGGAPRHELLFTHLVTNIWLVFVNILFGRVGDSE